MTPVLQEALSQMHSIHPRPEDLSQLLPLRNSLSAFETSVNETLEAIRAVLNDDEDMVAMLLTRAAMATTAGGVAGNGGDDDGRGGGSGGGGGLGLGGGDGRGSGDNRPTNTTTTTSKLDPSLHVTVEVLLENHYREFMVPSVGWANAHVLAHCQTHHKVFVFA